jgi:hypothetical protein
MNRILATTFIITALAGCSQDVNSVRITREPVVAMVNAMPRSEPIFYNGKTYKFDFAPAATGGYAVAVSGMTAKQQKDAIGLSTSALHYFACKDSQKTNILQQPIYTDGKWQMTANCL